MAVSGGLIAGSRGGPRGGAGPPLFLDQNEARRTEKKFFEACPHPLSQGLDDRPTPPTPPPPLCEGLDLPLDCNQFEGERERELMLVKLYSNFFCTDLVIDIDIDLERRFILPRGTQESQLVKTLNVKKKKKVEKLLKK